MDLGLRENVLFCTADGQFVFLDLQKDRYQAPPAACAAAFSRLLENANPSELDLQALEPLMRAGLLVPSDGGRLPYPAGKAKPAKSLLDGPLPNARGGLFLQALIYQIAAARDLRLAPLIKIVSDIRTRKRALGGRKYEVDGDRTKILTASFLATRQLISAQDKCLRESLALTRYLISHGLAPSLTLGVQMRPFAAHAWVEWEGLVLNDTVVRLRPHTPILQV